MDFVTTRNKVKLPNAYKPSHKTKILNKMEILQNAGSKRITFFEGSLEVETIFYLYLLKKYKSDCFLLNQNARMTRIVGLSVKINTTYDAQERVLIDTHLKAMANQFARCVYNNTKIIIVL